jgi:GT2 family glycosyltransferase
MNHQFSIILPVYNGMAYLKECIESILIQEPFDYNVIVLDSGSTDGSMHLIESYNSPKISIHKTNKRLSIEENWAQIKGVEKNEFMTIIGQDDILYPNYLHVMNELINEHPNASLYQTHFNYINANSETIRPCKPMPAHADAGKFLGMVLRNQLDIMATGFMMRSKDYEAVGGIPPYPRLLFADFELWVNIAGLSYMAVSPEPTFYFRLHQSTTSTSSDEALHHAFARFMDYLARLQQQQPAMKTVLEQNLPTFLYKYCQSFAHRLLRTPKSNRAGHTVSAIIQQFKDYSTQLIPAHAYNPVTNPSIRLAKLIDSNAITRWLFLLFKKIHPTPVYD